MITLPNNCYCSELSVHPQNWKQIGASVKKDWYIHYRFYDPMFSSEYPTGMLRIVKRMNRFKDLAARRQATKDMIATEIDILQNDGFNPITKKCLKPIANNNISETTSLLSALQFALDKKQCEELTRKD